MISIALRGLTSLVSCALALLGIALLASCGGGGATTDPFAGGPVQIVPADATFYAGSPATITITGFRPPYALSSSEPGVLPVPNTIDGNQFVVVPNNPSTVDAGLPPGAYPIRTVNVTVSAGNGTASTAKIHVGWNYLTPFLNNLVSALTAGTGTNLEFTAAFNGAVNGNDQFRLTAVVGPFGFVCAASTGERCSPDTAGAIVNTIVATSDHEGHVIARIVALTGFTSSQLAILRVTHVTTGASADRVFVINPTPPTSTSPAVLTAFPATITFTGLAASSCGTGTTDFLIFGAGMKAPVSAFSANPNVTVTPASTTSTNPARFTVTVSNGGNPPTCITNAPIVVTDGTGGQVTVQVSTVIGPASTPPQPLSVSPNAFTLLCNQSGSVTVVGGIPPYRFTSTHPQVMAIGGGNVITITRLNGDGATQFATTASIGVTDATGSAIQVVQVTVPANCP